MNRKHYILILMAFCLLSSGACKKGVPTAPDEDIILEFSGKITLDGESFSNVEIYLSWSTSKKTTTAVDGSFSFTNLARGNFVITPSKLGYAFSPSNYEVGIQTRNDLDFTAQLAEYGSELEDIASDFTAQDQNNDELSLYDFFGKVILFNFSADYCGACKNEASHLGDLYDFYKDKGFQVITLLISGNHSSWAEEYDLIIPVLDDRDGTIWDIYGEGYVPLNIIVDRNCVIRYKEAGYSEEDIRETVEKYL